MWRLHGASLNSVSALKTQYADTPDDFGCYHGAIRVHQRSSAAKASMFENFYGNSAVAQALADMAQRGRIPQTILLDGPEGVGKATLARRFAAHLLGSADKIEQDDLSLECNAEIIADREKWPADK